MNRNVKVVFTGDTKSLKHAGQEANAVLSSVTKALNATTAPLRGVSNAFNATANRALAFNHSVEALQGKMATIGRAARTMTAPLHAAGNAFKSLTAAASGVGLGGLAAMSTGVLGLAGAMGGLAKTGVDMNITVEGATAAMTRISGSAQGATRFIAALRAEAATSALTFKEMLGISQSLGAVYVEKFGPAGLGKVIPTMRVFQDAAAILRVDSGGLNFALGGFRQLAAAPTPTLEDIKQVDENLPGAGVRSIVRAAFGTDESETLAKAGKTGADVAAAIVAGLQKKFNGAQAAAANTIPIMLSNVQDGMDALGSRITVGLKSRLERALSTVLDTLNKFFDTAAGGRIVEALSRALDRVGDAAIHAARSLQPLIQSVAPFVVQTIRATAAVASLGAKLLGSRAIIGGLLVPWRYFGLLMERAAVFAPKVVRALEGFINVPGMIRLTADAFGLVQTAAQTVFRWLGVEGESLGEVLKLALNPEVVRQFAGRAYDFLSGLVKGGIKHFFGMSRVWGEVFTMMKSFGVDLGDTMQDVWADLAAHGLRAFAYLQIGISRFAVAAIDSVMRVADAMNVVLRVLTPGKEIKTGEMLGFREQAVNIGASGRGINAGLDLWKAPGGPRDQARQGRRDQRLKEDPHREQSPIQRIIDAYQGNGRDRSEEQRFNKDFETNRDRVRRDLFGQELDAPPPVQDPNAPRHPYGPTGGGGVAAAGLTRPAIPGGGMAGDPYRPVTLANGERTTAFIAESRGVPFTEGAASGGATVTSTSDGGNNVTINIRAGSFEEMEQQVMEILRRQARPVFSGPSRR